MTPSPSAEIEKALMSLIRAKDENVVEKILEDKFFADAIWKPVGGSDNNYATISNQQTDPINALCEKPINSIDHVLLKQCKLKDGDPEGPKAPKNMKDAVKKYFGITDGNFSELSQEERNELANNIMIIADGSKAEPNIIIADKGEGQKPDDFEDTLLSLQKGNKKKIKFVQGKYNMGGTGVLPFCGKKGYQLILARKSVELAGKNSEWGFTLVREKPDVSNDYKTTWYEYCTDSNSKIFRISGKPLKILPNKKEMEDGCFIKLYNYELPHPSVITASLWKDLCTKLYSPALPIFMFENRPLWQYQQDEASNWGSKILHGNKYRLGKDRGKNVYKNFSLNSRLKNFGTNKIDVIVIKHASMIRTKNNRTKDYRKDNEVVLLTQNGQTHGILSKALFKSKTNLTSLADYIMIHVDLTNIPTAKAKMFMASRDRVRKSDDYKELVERIFGDIAGDDQLKSINAEYKKLDDENSAKSSSMQAEIVKVLRKNPNMIKLLRMGKYQVEAENKTPVDKSFNSNYIPTFLKVRGVKEAVTHKKQIPCDGKSTSIYFQTDAPDDYTIREHDQGQLIVEWDENILNGIHYGPNNGMIKVKLDGKGINGDQIGDLKVTLTRLDMEPLECIISLYFGEPKKGPDHKPPTPEDDSGVSIPDFRWVARDNWGILNWNENSVAKADSDTISINRDCIHLEEFKRHRPSEDGSKITASFGFSIYMYSLVLYYDLKDDEDYEIKFQKAIESFAKCCLLLAYDIDKEIMEHITKQTNAIAE